jgi:AcrR family transcriptional regulator
MPSAVYYYVKTKDDLISEVVTSYVEQVDAMPALVDTIPDCSMKAATYTCISNDPTGSSSGSPLITTYELDWRRSYLR